MCLSCVVLPQLYRPQYAATLLAVVYSGAVMDARSGLFLVCVRCEQTYVWVLQRKGFILVIEVIRICVEDTCNKEPSICAHTKYRKIRLQRDNLSLGDWQETYHRRSVSSSVQGNTPKVRRRVMGSPLASVVPLFSSTSFSSLHITKGTCSPWQRVKSATAPASVYDRSQWP